MFSENRYGTMMVVKNADMPTTLTLKNIPDELYGRLKAAAKRNRRSLNSEAIVNLEAMLVPRAMPPTDHLARARELRAQLGDQPFSAHDVDAFKADGRP